MNHTVGVVLKVVLVVAIALAAFTTGLGAPAPGPQSLWRQRSQLMRALLAVLVAVPLWAFAFLEILPLAQAVRAGIFVAVLSVGIGPIAGMKRFQGSTPAVHRAFELNVTMLLISIVYVPLMVALLAWAFRRPDLSLGLFAVAKIVLLRALIPLALGFAVAHIYPRLAAKIHRPFTVAVNVVVALVLVVALVAMWRQLASVGLGGWLAAFGVAVGAVVIGHLLGGPSLETRAPLASAAAMRFPALALLLANVFPLGKQLVPPVLVYILASLITVAVYGRVMQRRSSGARPARPARPAHHAPEPTPA